MSSQEVRRLYLGARDLDDADRRLLQVFLRFAGKTTRHQWTLADADEEDLVLRVVEDDGSTVPMPLALKDEAPVVWIMGRDQKPPVPGAMALYRPLQIEPFAELLRLRESQFEPAQTPPATAPTMRTGAAPQSAPPKVLPARPLPAGSPMERAASAARGSIREAADLPPGRSAPARPFVANPADSYRLVKWPNADLMRGKPKFVRMLGFLTQRALSVERLILLSGLDERSCLDMLAMLDERGLLAVVQEAPEVATTAGMTAAPRTREEHLHSAISGFSAAPPKPPTVATAPPGVQGNLFQRLRKRWGL